MLLWVCGGFLGINYVNGKCYSIEICIYGLFLGVHRHFGLCSVFLGGNYVVCHGVAIGIGVAGLYVNVVARRVGTLREITIPIGRDLVVPQ